MESLKLIKFLTPSGILTGARRQGGEGLRRTVTLQRAAKTRVLGARSERVQIPFAPTPRKVSLLRSARPESLVAEYEPTVPLPLEGPLAPPAYVRQQIAKSPWKGGLEPTAETAGYEAVVEGKIPADLNGTAFFAGSGRIRIGHHLYGHWFDGDGAIYSISLQGSLQGSGRAVFRCRFARTEKFLAQQEATTNGSEGIATPGAWTKRRQGGWLDNGLRLPSNPSNTGILLPWGRSRAYAVLCEAGLPLTFDPHTLETGEFLDIRDESPAGRKLAPSLLEWAFSAHHKVHGRTGVLYNFGLVKPLIGTYKLFALAPDTPHVIQQSTLFQVRFQGADQGLTSALVPLVHDFAISDHHAVFVVPPWVADRATLFFSALGFTAESLGHQFRWRPDLGTRLMVFNLETMSLVMDTELPLLDGKPLSLYHLANAWEYTCGSDEPGPFLNASSDKAGAWPERSSGTPSSQGWRAASSQPGPGKQHRLELICCCLNDGDRPSLERAFSDMYGSNFSSGNRQTLWRIQVDLASKTVLSSGPALGPSSRRLEMEFPVVSPHVVGMPSRFLYMSAHTGPDKSTNFDSVQKVDLATGQVETASFGSWTYPNEPVFVPRGRPASGGDSQVGSAPGCWEEGEDYGYLLTHVYDASRHKSFLVVLDAQNVTGPPLAKVHLKQHIPYTFHGCWDQQE
eukprot:jgi/Mesvir1/14479/Mv05186-RA.1